MTTLQLDSTRVWLLTDADPLPGWVDADALAPDEVARLARTRHPAAREHFRRGRLTVRSLLAMTLGCHPREVVFTVSPDGKPEVPGVHFNVSHTAGLVAVAVGPGPVGIDVEAADAGRDVVGLVNRFFAAEEREQFARLPEPLRPPAFLRGWTCKEALLKGIGSGVRDLQNCAVCLDPDQPPRVLRSPVPGWKLTTWAEGEIGVAVAVGGELTSSA
jgi:4'-phosphopantetheinyl transferase